MTRAKFDELRLGIGLLVETDGVPALITRITSWTEGGDDTISITAEEISAADRAFAHACTALVAGQSGKK